MATDLIAAPVAGEPSVAVRTALLMVEPAVIPVIVKSLVVEAVVGVVIPGTGSLTTVHVLVRLKFVTVKVACGTYFTPFLRCSLGFPCTDKPSVNNVECHIALFIVSDD